MPAKKEQLSMTEAAEMFGQLATIKHSKSELESQLGLSVTEIRKRYETKFAELDNQILLIEQRLQQFASIYRHSLGKSIPFVHGTLSFKDNPPRIDIEEGKEEKVIRLLERKHPDAVAISKSINKKYILSKKNDKAFIASIARMGVTIQQNETFYITLNPNK
jgi:phage host-nuclease inhibitor protein Gam